MGSFFDLFRKKKKHEGINEFSVPEKTKKNKKHNTTVDDDFTPKTAATVKPVVVTPEKATPTPIAESEDQKTKAEIKKEDLPVAKATTNKESAPASAEMKKAAAKAEKPAAKPEPKKAAPKAEKPAAKEEVKKVAPKAEPDTEVDQAAKNARTGRFEIKKTKDGRFVFNLYAPNHVIVATSQVYSSSTAAVNGIKSIINNAEKAPLEDNTLKNPTEQPFPKWEMYIDKGGQFRFRLFASNGSCVVHSQGYTAKNSCKKGIESIIKCAKDAEIDKSYLKKEEK